MLTSCTKVLVWALWSFCFVFVKLLFFAHMNVYTIPIIHPLCSLLHYYAKEYWKHTFFLWVGKRVKKNVDAMSYLAKLYLVELDVHGENFFQNYPETWLIYYIKRFFCVDKNYVKSFVLFREFLLDLLLGKWTYQSYPYFW